MTRVKKFAKFIMLSIGMFIFLIALDMAILMYIAIVTHDDMSNVPVGFVAENLSKNTDENDQEKYALSKDGYKTIEKFNGFAFLINDSGDVTWEYNMPSELPRHYTLKDTVRFSRYYLNDYPVYTRITDYGIVVMGTPKDRTWKYTLIFQVNTLETFMKTFSVVALINIALIFLVPFLIMKHDFRRREKERTTWIAGVSHDIRTPLSLVLGYADEIANISKSDKNQKDISDKAQIIEDQAMRIRTLITNLNTENKLTYGMGKWHREKALLPAIIRDVTCDIINRCREDKYDICVSISENLEQLYVYGDKELIKRAMENLINNALTHNPQGCHIDISLIKYRRYFINYNVLEVSDNGSGIEKKFLKKLKRKPDKDTLPEHGLGLRLVRQIAAFHHWRIKFFNNAQGGFSCRIYIH